MFSDDALEFFELNETVLGAIEGGSDGRELFLGECLLGTEAVKEIID